MRIYTRTGDDGTTGLFGGARVPKCHSRVEAYGSLDELNSMIGLVRAGTPPSEIDDQLWIIQEELFLICAEVACVAGKEIALGLSLLEDSAVNRLEQGIDETELRLPPLQSLILPTGTPTSAALQVARAITRRSERALLRASLESPVRPVLLRYLNRLSDLLFVLARRANQLGGVSDVVWKGRDK